jgi:hypothetical protein
MYSGFFKNSFTISKIFTLKKDSIAVDGRFYRIRLFIIEKDSTSRGTVLLPDQKIIKSSL